MAAVLFTFDALPIHWFFLDQDRRRRGGGCTLLGGSPASGHWRDSAHGFVQIPLSTGQRDESLKVTHFENISTAVSFTQSVIKLMAYLRLYVHLRVDQNMILHHFTLHAVEWAL